MKQTLLGIVQDILSDMGSDRINSIGETEESNQVASVVKHTFFEMITRKDWPHLRRAAQLSNVNNSLFPTKMLIPTDASRLDYIAYSQQRQLGDNITFKQMSYMYPDEFLTYTGRRNPDNDNVIKVDDGLTYYIYTDAPPTYYTSFDDKHIIFDSWCDTLSTTTTAEFSQVVFYESVDWTTTDEFVMNLPAEAFPMLYAEAKSTCFLELKQIVNSKAEQQAVRQNYVMGQRNWAVKGGVRYPNYGRQSRKFNGGRHFNPNQYTGTTP